MVHIVPAAHRTPVHITDLNIGDDIPTGHRDLRVTFMGGQSKPRACSCGGGEACACVWGFNVLLDVNGQVVTIDNDGAKWRGEISVANGMDDYAIWGMTDGVNGSDLILCTQNLGGKRFL